MAAEKPPCVVERLGDCCDWDRMAQSIPGLEISGVASESYWEEATLTNETAKTISSLNANFLAVLTEFLIMRIIWQAGADCWRTQHCMTPMPG